MNVNRQSYGWLGGGVPAGGSKHAGHAVWLQVMNPYENAGDVIGLPTQSSFSKPLSTMNVVKQPTKVPSIVTKKRAKKGKRLRATVVEEDVVSRGVQTFGGDPPPSPPPENMVMPAAPDGDDEVYDGDFNDTTEIPLGRTSSAPARMSGTFASSASGTPPGTPPSPPVTDASMFDDTPNINEFASAGAVGVNLPASALQNSEELAREQHQPAPPQPNIIVQHFATPTQDQGEINRMREETNIQHQETLQFIQQQNALSEQRSNEQNAYYNNMFATLARSHELTVAELRNKTSQEQAELQLTRRELEERDAAQRVQAVMLDEQRNRMAQDFNTAVERLQQQQNLSARQLENEKERLMIEASAAQQMIGQQQSYLDEKERQLLLTSSEFTQASLAEQKQLADLHSKLTEQERSLAERRETFSQEEYERRYEQMKTFFTLYQAATATAMAAARGVEGPSEPLVDRNPVLPGGKTLPQITNSQNAFNAPANPRELQTTLAIEYGAIPEPSSSVVTRRSKRLRDKRKGKSVAPKKLRLE